MRVSVAGFFCVAEILLHYAAVFVEDPTMSPKKYAKMISMTKTIDNETVTRPKNFFSFES